MLLLEELRNEEAKQDSVSSSTVNTSQKHTNPSTNKAIPSTFSQNNRTISSLPNRHALFQPEEIQYKGIINLLKTFKPDPKKRHQILCGC